MSIVSMSTEDFLNAKTVPAQSQPTQQVQPKASAGGIDFDSDEPLACPMRKEGDYSICEACQ